MTNSIRQLLVHVDAATSNKVRLTVARQLAQKHGAALTALYAATPSFIATAYVGDIGTTVAATMMEIDDERRSRAHTMFDQIMNGSSLRADWSELIEPPVIGGFAEQALYADLLVLGQFNPADIGTGDVPRDFPESVISASGKPALIIPYAGQPSSVGDIVVIAWKPTRESARALAAAMPLISRASQVHVVTWSADPGFTAVSGAALGLEQYLRLHQIEPVWHHYSEEPHELGELLLSRVADLEADLLVMGCYGHSRAREWVLGGTSRTVLHSTTVPVLMAH